MATHSFGPGTPSLVEPVFRLGCVEPRLQRRRIACRPDRTRVARGSCRHRFVLKSYCRQPGIRLPSQNGRSCGASGHRAGLTRLGRRVAEPLRTSVRRSDHRRKERRGRIHAARFGLGLRSAGTAHLRSDQRDPSQQAPRRLRQRRSTTPSPSLKKHAPKTTTARSS